jgi:phage/conjugal plasmid C-4 type zinc finger TraR family protein
MDKRMTNSRMHQRREILHELVSWWPSSDGTGRSPPRAMEATEALRRMNVGMYGVCADCGHRIPAARLRVKPEATRCVACQTEFERQSTA